MPPYSGDEFEEFFAAYIDAAIFFDAPEGYCHLDLNDESIEQAKIDCKKFLDTNFQYIGNDYLFQAGHDFWLTRNRHGDGYWGRPEVYGGIKTAKILTDSSHKFGELNIDARLESKNEHDCLYFY